MRLFVSVEPSTAAVAALTRALAAADLGATRPVPAERWHITLAFLGEVGADRLPRLEGGLASATASLQRIRLQVSGGGTFPRRGGPSVLWAGLTGDVDGLRRVALAVRRAVRGAGVPLEKRPFAPHLTVERYRNAPPGAADAAVTALSRHTGPAFEIDEVRLMRSHLGPHPRHELVRSWQLGADQPPGGAGQRYGSDGAGG